MTNLQIAFIFLIVFSLGFHWAAWRRFSECDVRCKSLEVRALQQAKQIATLDLQNGNGPRMVFSYGDSWASSEATPPLTCESLGYPKRPDEV